MNLRSGCPLNVTLEMVGDKWSLLIIRDLLNGKFTFTDFLKSNEDIAKNILAERLKRLMNFKIIYFKNPIGNNKVKNYFLTKKGLDLYPAMVELMLWSDTYLSELITSDKGKNFLDEIKNKGKDIVIDTKISNYKSKLKKVVF